MITRRQFVEDVFYALVFDARVLAVGFQLPFDLSRLAVDWRRARGRDAGGFSLILHQYFDRKSNEWRENRFRPTIAIKTVDSKRHFIRFKGAREPDRIDKVPEGSESGASDERYVFHGHFLDLRTLAFALTNKSHSLASACSEFRVKHGKEKVEEHGLITPAYVEYNRRDVLATYELALALLAEYDRHPISPGPPASVGERTRPLLAETHAYSPAGIGKAYLRLMGITPLLSRQTFPRVGLGHAMTAYYGGRAECRIRKLVLPVVTVDFMSQYPTCDALMGLWQFETAERIDLVDATSETRRFVRSVNADDLYRPETWRRLPVLVQVDPAGEVFPVRARYSRFDKEWQIGVNPFTAGRRLWFTLPDVIAAKLLTGRAPRVISARRLVPRGRLRRLQPVRLQGEVEVDPAKTDFFRRVIEERQTIRSSDRPLDERKRVSDFLKVLANASSYGIFGEINREDAPRGKADMAVYGLGKVFTDPVAAVERTGEFFFAPLAAIITGAGRLLLALLEHAVETRGGTYLMCDTDALAVVATESGGDLAAGQDATAIRALSWSDVEEIREAFAALSPYDRTRVPGSILQLVEHNYDVQTGGRQQLYGLAISAKRYVLFNRDEDGKPTVRKPSEHGLGHLLNPQDPDAEEDAGWIEEAWRYVAGEAVGAVQPPTWLDTIAASQTTASTSSRLDAFRTYNRDKPYDEQIKPFNFLLSAQIAPLGHPPGVRPERFHLVAPYERRPHLWRQLRWFDIYSGNAYRVTTGQRSAGSVRVRTYGEILADLATHPESKTLAPDGRPCDRQTVGPLRRRPVALSELSYLGKEADRLEDREMGLVHDESEVTTTYADPSEDRWLKVHWPRLRATPTHVAMRVTSASRSTVKRWKAGQSNPRGRNLRKIQTFLDRIRSEQNPY